MQSSPDEVMYAKHLPVLAAARKKAIQVALGEGGSIEAFRTAVKEASPHSARSSSLVMHFRQDGLAVRAAEEMKWSPLNDMLRKRAVENANEEVSVYVSFGEVYGKLHQDRGTSPHVLVQGQKRWIVCCPGAPVPSTKTVYPIQQGEESIAEIVKHVDEATLCTKGDTMIVRHMWYHAVHSSGPTIGVVWYWSD